GTTKFEASARRAAGIYYALLDVGVVQALDRAALEIWNHPFVLPELGMTRALEGRAEEETLEAIFGDRPQHVVDMRLRSICPVRAEASWTTLMAGLRFIWLHEIAHVLGGHVDFCSNHSAGFGIAEHALAGAEPDEPHAPAAERALAEIPFVA